MRYVQLKEVLFNKIIAINESDVIEWAFILYSIERNVSGGGHATVLFVEGNDSLVLCGIFIKNLRKLFKNPCSQAELNKIVPFGFSLQRQKMVFFCH